MRATDGTQNFYIFRLADILLLKAEALAHTGNLTGAMALVNQNAALLVRDSDAKELLIARSVELLRQNELCMQLS